MKIQITKNDRTSLFNTKQVPDIILGPGNNWEPGTSIIDDFPFSPVPDSVLEVIENHINEGNLTHGKIDGYTWQIVKAHPKQKLFIKYMPKQAAQKSYYIQILNNIDFDDQYDIQNLIKAVKAVLALLRSLKINKSEKV